MFSSISVSYTHLDVYKRQTLRSQVAGQFKVIVLFGSQRNIADMAVCGFLIVLELLYAGF